MDELRISKREMRLLYLFFPPQFGKKDSGTRPRKRRARASREENESDQIWQLDHFKIKIVTNSFYINISNIL